jgi:hypothetical protein
MNVEARPHSAGTLSCLETAFCRRWVRRMAFVHFTQNIKTIPEGERHRKQRKMLNPVFSIAHMREMSKDGFLANKILISPSLVPIFYEVTHKV